MTKNPLRRWFGRNESVTELGARQSKKEENDANTGNHSSGGDTGPTIRALKGDIASQGCDVVVNAANERLGNGAGVAGAIIKAAGPGLLRECADRYPDGCPTGEARITGGHDLPAKWIVHTVGPQWSDGTNGEPELLADCYRNSLQAAAEIGARTVAFPAISTGSFHYPREGDRVRLIRTSDAYTSLLSGAQGTVRRIDDAGTVHVNWDCGSRLGLVPGEDSWVILRRTQALDIPLTDE